MQPTNLVVHLALSAVLIIGAYQFYFFCQRHILFEPRELRLPIDDCIPFQPAWVWIYGVGDLLRVSRGAHIETYHEWRRRAVSSNTSAVPDRVSD